MKNFKIKASQAQHLWWIVLSQALMVTCDDLTRCEKSLKTNMCPKKFGPFQSQYGIHWSSNHRFSGDMLVFRGDVLTCCPSIFWEDFTLVHWEANRQLLTYQRGKNPPEGPIFRWFDLQHNRFSVDHSHDIWLTIAYKIGRWVPLSTNTGELWQHSLWHLWPYLTALDLGATRAVLAEDRLMDMIRCSIGSVY